MTTTIVNMAREDFDESGLAVAEAEGKTRLKRPPLYKVLLHNDDYTSMEFVVFILRTVFDRSEADAVTIMLNVHRQGIGVAGLYTFEIAEMKTAKVARLAEASEFPLLCTFEEVAEDDS